MPEVSAPQPSTAAAVPGAAGGAAGPATQNAPWTAASGPVVQCDQLSVRYGKNWALRDVTAVFQPGAVGLLGPNGAGKSTLIKTLLGFIVPDKGAMTVLGLNVATSPLEIRARIGYMPETDSHIPGMNAVSFVAYCGQLSGLPPADAMQRAHEVLYYVGLGEARYRNLETYSTGMKQRIKLAQAIVHDPDLLFLDEPTNGMDPKGRDEMLELIYDLAHRKNVNLILSSHLLPDVEYTCEHVVVVDKGTIATQGAIAALKGPRGRIYEMRIKGDTPQFIQVLRGEGFDCHDTDEDVMRVFVPVTESDADGARQLFSLAARERVQVRHLRPSVPTLEDVFARAVGIDLCMPIHDQGYRRYLGTRAAVGRGWTVIALAGIKSIIAKRAFIGLMLFAWGPFVVRSVQIYVAANFPQAASILQVNSEMFREFLEQQSVFVFFVTIWVGASLISADRRANALQLYLSKPLTALEYVAGKLAILFSFLVLVTWVPAIALLIVQTVFAGSFAFVRANVFLLPAITLFALAQVLLASMTMLALSSMSKSSRFVGVMYAGLMFFTSALFNALRGITGSSQFAWLSPNAALDQLGDVIFRLNPRYELPPALAALTVLVLLAASALVLRRNVKGVEVVT